MADAGDDLEALANQGLAIMKRQFDRIEAAQLGRQLPDGVTLAPDEVGMVEKFTRVALQALRLQGDDDPGAYTPEELQAIAKGENVPRKGKRR